MKTTKRPGVINAESTTTQRLNIRVTPEAYERLLVHAIKARKSPGELVTELIESGLRTYRVQVNPTVQAKAIDRHVSAPELNLDAPLNALEDAA